MSVALSKIVAEGNSENSERSWLFSRNLIDAVCRVSGSFDFIDAGTQPSLLAKILKKKCTPSLFNWMMDSFSFQGISNSAAQKYIDRHGNASWDDLTNSIRKAPACNKLNSYWSYQNCGYDKTRVRCAEPSRLSQCPVPKHQLRNGRLNQTAYSFYFFVRDIAQNDLLGWIDSQLLEWPRDKHSIGLAQEALVGPMRQIFGISDKVITMTLSEVLMALPEVRPDWFFLGSQMIVVDTLVHNFLHRTGILRRLGQEHSYGSACYSNGRCADILREASAHIDARRFNKDYPENFPRFVQHALWHYCAAEGENVCNGNTIDDRESCLNKYCILFRRCDKIELT